MRGPNNLMQNSTPHITQSPTNIHGRERQTLITAPNKSNTERNHGTDNANRGEETQTRATTSPTTGDMRNVTRAKARPVRHVTKSRNELARIDNVITQFWSELATTEIRPDPEREHKARTEETRNEIIRL